MNEERRKKFEELENASPLEAVGLLRDIELYDAKSSQEIIDEVYEQFEGGEHKVENIVVPVFTSIADGFLKDASVGKALKRKGLTATRIVNECRNFSYEDEINTYSEVVKNQVITENAKKLESFNDRIDSNVTQEYDRGKYGYSEKERDTFFDKKFGDNKTMKDEYGSGDTIFRSKTERDNRRRDGDNTYRAELDHIVPLEKVHEQLKSNCLLNDEDIKKIANDESNYAITSRKINNKKRSDYNDEFANGEKADDLGLDEKTRETMKEKGRTAQKNIDKNANKAVLQHLKNGDKKEELKTAAKNISKEAVKDSENLFIGTIIMEVIKPVYYEMKDCVVNGIKEPVGIDSLSGALAYRLGRIKNHVFSNLARIGIDGLGDLIKSIVSALIQGIVDLFFGIVKTMLKIAVEGIGIAVSAVKILSSKDMTDAQKGDAVVKLVGGALIGILGNILIDKLKLPKVWNAIVSGVISGCGVLFFMILLDKIDIFSVKAEKRRERIFEIFDERIKDINEAAERMDTYTIEVLKKQRTDFENITSVIDDGFENNDIDAINDGLFNVAKFMGVELEYSNHNEFISFMDGRKIREI